MKKNKKFNSNQKIRIKNFVWKMPGISAFAGDDKSLLKKYAEIHLGMKHFDEQIHHFVLFFSARLQN